MTERIVTDVNGSKHITTEPMPIQEKREWVGLTEEEVEQIVDGNTHNAEGYQFWCSGKGVAEGVEAKLKEKNYERRTF